MKEVKLNYLSFLTPDYLYIPFDDKNNLNINKKSNIYIGMLLGKNISSQSLFSPASGNLIGVKPMFTTKGLSNVLILENDFRDKRKSYKGYRNINELKKKDIIDIIEYFNLNKDFNKKEYLIINISYNQKQDKSNSFIVSENSYNLLEIADFLIEVFDIKECIFLINNKDDVTIESLSRYIGTYPNLKIVTKNKNIKDFEVSKYLYNKKEKNCITYNLFELYQLYNAIKRNRYTSEKFLTIYGNNIDTKVLYVKIGTSLEDILAVLRLKTIAKKVCFITNESEINVENFEAIITNDVKSIKIN